MPKSGSSGSGEDGNTKSSSRQLKSKVVRDSPRKTWCFTWNNYDGSKDIDFLKNLLKNDSYIFGEEVGENGTPHLQGYIKFVKKVRFGWFKSNLPKVHCEPAKGTDEDNINYCSKDGKCHSKGLTIKKPLKILERDHLYNWQREIIKIVEAEPDDRTINWFWEPTGRAGKTTFTKFLCYHYNAVPVEGKKNDILYTVSEFESDIYVFDFERSMEDYISYSAIEKVKNGIFMNSKYESKPIIRNSPHIICFANFKPDEEKLSSDRWNIVRIKKDKPN